MITILIKFKTQKKRNYEKKKTKPEADPGN